MAHLGLNADWAGCRALVTGHTGFKGAWLALLLEHLGATACGVSLAPEATDGAYAAMAPWPDLDHHEVDIRDRAAIVDVVRAFRPDVVFHLAAQALVRRSYRQPAETFDTNILGTWSVLDAVASVDDAVPCVVVTSDKVYRPSDDAARVEDDPLGGRDPYSASKACAELVVTSFRTLHPAAPVVTARAGNVIGGGDQGEDRLVPDVLRSATQGQVVVLRNPGAVRPWQHVLDPLRGYVLVADRLLEGADLPSAFNFGPTAALSTVAEITELLFGALGTRGRWERSDAENPPETNVLQLDCSLAAAVLGWRPCVPLPLAVRWTARWHHAAAGARRGEARRQIDEFEELANG